MLLSYVELICHAEIAEIAEIKSFCAYLRFLRDVFFFISKE